MTCLFLGGAAKGLARPQSVTIRNGCTAGPLTVARPSDTVSLTRGQCYKSGRPIATVVPYRYTQSDDEGVVCGSVSGKTGRSFTPRISGTYSVRATFTVTPKYKDSGIRPKSVSSQLLMSHSRLKCGKLDPANPPGFAQMCDYQFNDPQNPADNCGSVIKSANSTYMGNYPTWNSKPRVDGLTIKAPTFVSPSGRCTQMNQISQSRGFRWMGQPIFTAYWDCDDGLSIAPLVYLYYYGPGASSATCSFGERNLNLGGEYTQFTLPDVSTSWGGTLYVVWKMLVSYNQGPYVAHVFADKMIPLSGTTDACAELSRRS